MKKLLTLSALTSASLLATLAQATPMIEPKCTRDIQHPPGSTGVMFNETCSIAYIKPPTKGDAHVEAIAQNLNLNFCPAVSRVSNTTDRLIVSADLIADQLEAMIEGFGPLSEAIEAAQTKVGTAKADRDEAVAVEEAATADSQELRTAAADAQLALNDCMLFSPGQCTDAQSALDQAKAEYRDFLVEVLRPAQADTRAKQAAFDRAVAEQSTLAKRYGEALDPLLALQQRLFDLNNSMMEVYREYAPLEGATGQIVYSIPWDDLLQDYQRLNPGVTFESLPLKDALFTASAKFSPSSTTSLPAVLEAALPGLSPRGPLKLPSGGKVSGLGEEGNVPQLNERSVGFGSSLSGQIVLSLLGACPYFPEGVDTTKGALSEIDFDQLTAHMTANLHYKYEVKARRGYTATYNFSQWASRLEKKIKRGGFLSSKSIHEVVTDGDSSEWFSIKFDQDAAKFGYSQEEQKLIGQEVKSQLTERALRLVAIQDGSLGGPPPSPSLSPTGAGVAAGYLIRGCGFWSWCTVGGFFLGTLDSIFGRSEAISNFKKSNAATVTEKVSNVTVLDWDGSLTFGRREDE